MRLSKYLLNCHKTICGAHFSDRFCIGYLDRFFISISIKIVTCNYRVKCHIVFVSTTFENISNLPSKGTDKHQMQLMNKSMNFSVRAYHAILSLFFFYVYVCCSATYIFPNLFQKLKYHISGVFFSFSSGWQLRKIGKKFLEMRGDFYSKQRIYHIRNALLSRFGDPHITSPYFPSRFPLFSLFSYLGGCKTNRWYSPHLDFHFFHIWESVKLLDVIPPTSSKNILNIYK